MRRTKPPNLFELENLEPRVMLSGDPVVGAIGIIVAPDSFDYENSVLDRKPPIEEKINPDVISSENLNNFEPLEYNPSEKISDIYSGLVEENPFTGPESDVVPEEASNLAEVFDDPTLIEETAVSSETQITINPYQTDGLNIQDLTLNDLNETDDNVKKLLTKSLISANGPPPQLPGLELVDSDTSRFAGQIFWLNFEGAEDITYNGPVIIKHIDIPAFKVPDSLAGQEQEIFDSVVAQLQDMFAPSGVIFTTTQPVENTEYSTIYIGGYDSAFSQYGSFRGIAEQVDAGNKNPSDNAFVFSERLGAPPDHINEYVATLASITAHETGRLLGYKSSFPDPDDGPLDAVASPGDSDYQGGDGNWHNNYVTLDAAGSQKFEVQGIARNRDTKWYVGSAHKETDSSGFWATDPNYTWYFSSGTTTIEAKIYDGSSLIEGHRWYVTVEADTTKPYNPSSFSSSPSRYSWTTDNTIKVSWSGASDNKGLKGYYYKWSTSSSSSVSTSNSYVSTSSGSGNRTSSGLADSSNWYFHVRYKDTSDNLASSTAHYGPFKIDRSEPSKPTLLTPIGDIAISDNTPRLDWTSSSDGSGSGVRYYELVVESDTWGINKIHKTTLTSSQYTPTSSEALPNERLKWRVRTQDWVGKWSNWTSNQYFTVDTDFTKPSAVKSLAINGGTSWNTDNTPKFTWDDATDASGIKEYWWSVDDSTPTSGWSKLTPTFFGESVTLSTALNDGSHTFRVYAVDKSANANKGPVTSLPFTIDANAPSVPTLTVPIGDITISDSTPLLNYRQRGRVWQRGPVLRACCGIGLLGHQQDPQDDID